MIIVFFFTFVFLSFPPSLHSATDHNIFMSICSKGLRCLKPAPFEFPFYIATDKVCGLIKVHCTLEGGKIQLGKQYYEIVEKFDNGFSVMIYKITFKKLMKNKTCEAFISPIPCLYSISIDPFVTLFNYPKNLSYFNQSNFNSYNRCTHYNFYYNYLINNATIPSDLSHTCQVIRLPVKERWQLDHDGHEISSLLSRDFPISSEECKKKDGHCDIDNGDFQWLPVKNGANEVKKGTILVTALTIGVLMILIVIILCLIRKLKQRRKTKTHLNEEIFLQNNEFLSRKRYTYSQLKKMTNSFEVKLGQGGFSSVYKGSLSNGNLVAVKVLSELKGNGEDFINEVASVGHTSHVNIVSLVGFCLEGSRRALIYEFMPNGSLERFIYDQASTSNSHLGWETLHQIAIGVARGLEYLHRGCNSRILHFDIKPHNILLDQDFCPKISDFGLAKLFPKKASMISMSHSRGTPGYIAPELFSKNFGKVSHKSDVYSYGMMILEMVGGRKNIEVEVDHTSEIYFPHWIYKQIESDEKQLGLQEIVSDEENEMVRKMIIVGLWCIQTNPLTRPTITKVLEMLEAELASLEIPPKPYLTCSSRSTGSPSKD